MKEEFYKQITELEELSCKLNGCQSIIALCAANLQGDESGALWAVSDILSETEKKIDDKLCFLLEIYKTLKEPVKGKKK